MAVCWQKCWQYYDEILTPILALASLRGTTQKEQVLFCVALPKVAKASKPGVFVEQYRHRNQKSKIDCLRFVMCPLLAPVFQGFFLQWPLTVLMKQSRQAVCVFKLSILLRCLWIPLRVLTINFPNEIKALSPTLKFNKLATYFSHRYLSINFRCL